MERKHIGLCAAAAVSALVFLSACAKQTDERKETAYSRKIVAEIIETAPVDSVCALLTPLLSAADSAELSALAKAEWSRLADPNSPWRDEARHIAYLQAMISSGLLSVADSLRYVHEISLRGMNQPGAIAADFAFATADGTRHTLADFLPDRLLLLVFYDPECPPCHESIEMLAASDRLNSQIAADSLAVLAVYAEGDAAVWRSDISSMPENWHIAIDLDSIVDHSLYHIPAMPTLYLLSPSRRVILKDPPVSTLLTQAGIEW